MGKLVITVPIPVTDEYRFFLSPELYLRFHTILYRSGCYGILCPEFNDAIGTWEAFQTAASKGKPVTVTFFLFRAVKYSGSYLTGIPHLIYSDHPGSEWCTEEYRKIHKAATEKAGILELQYFSTVINFQKEEIQLGLFLHALYICAGFFSEYGAAGTSRLLGSNEPPAIKGKTVYVESDPLPETSYRM